MLQMLLGVRFAIAGDGESKSIQLDLRKAIVQFGTGHYGVLPAVPDNIVSVSIGGPDINPENAQLTRIRVHSALQGPILTLVFLPVLIYSAESYTVEIVFGYLGLQPQPAKVAEVPVLEYALFPAKL